jgi:polyhydroxyalkanoate synthesis regulator phasin
MNVIETLRSYMQLAAGLLESTSERAKETAGSLISQSVEAGSKGPEAVSAQVQEIADDLIEQGRTNRELLVGLIRTEVERAVGRMGFVREEELAAVRKHVERLEREVNQRGDQASAAANLAVSTATSAVPAASKAAARATDTALKASKAAAGAARTATGTRRTPGRSAQASTASTEPAATAPAKESPTKETATEKTAAKKPAAKKAPAKKAPAKKPAAKKTAATKATAKKTSSATSKGPR